MNSRLPWPQAFVLGEPRRVFRGKVPGHQGREYQRRLARRKTPRARAGVAEKALGRRCHVRRDGSAQAGPGPVLSRARDNFLARSVCTSPGRPSRWRAVGAVRPSTVTRAGGVPNELFACLWRCLTQRGLHSISELVGPLPLHGGGVTCRNSTVAVHRTCNAKVLSSILSCGFEEEGRYHTHIFF